MFFLVKKQNGSDGESRSTEITTTKNTSNSYRRVAGSAYRTPQEDVRLLETDERMNNFSELSLMGPDNVSTSLQSQIGSLPSQLGDDDKVNFHLQVKAGTIKMRSQQFFELKDDFLKRAYSQLDKTDRNRQIAAEQAEALNINLHGGSLATREVIEKYNVDEMIKWLCRPSIGLASLASAFRESEIDGRVFFAAFDKVKEKLMSEHVDESLIQRLESEYVRLYSGGVILKSNQYINILPKDFDQIFDYDGGSSCCTYFGGLLIWCAIIFAWIPVYFLINEDAGHLMLYCYTFFFSFCCIYCNVQILSPMQYYLSDEGPYPAHFIHHCCMILIHRHNCDTILQCLDSVAHQVCSGRKFLFLALESSQDNEWLLNKIESKYCNDFDKMLYTIRDGVRDLRTHAELCATKFFEENDYNLDTVLLLKIDADCKCNKGLLSELESTYTQLTLEEQRRAMFHPMVHWKPVGFELFSKNSIILPTVFNYFQPLHSGELFQCANLNSVKDCGFSTRMKIATSKCSYFQRVAVQNARLYKLATGFTKLRSTTGEIDTCFQLFEGWGHQILTEFEYIRFILSWFCCCLKNHPPIKSRCQAFGLILHELLVLNFVYLAAIPYSVYLMLTTYLLFEDSWMEYYRANAYVGILCATLSVINYLITNVRFTFKKCNCKGLLVIVISPIFLLLYMWVANLSRICTLIHYGICCKEYKFKDKREGSQNGTWGFAINFEGNFRDRQKPANLWTFYNEED